MSHKMFNFEEHITVKVNFDQTDLFTSICVAHGAKPITINLHNGENHVMTSKTIQARSLCDVLSEKSMLINFSKHNIEVVRRKIEAEPNWVNHQANIGLNRSDSYIYFEIHIPCHSDKIQLLGGLISSKWHKSSNEFKSGVTFLTYRTKNEEDIVAIDEDISIMKQKDVACPNFKHHYEYAIYDENEALDANWLTP